MTEIPEHLLKRSASARAKASGGDAPAASDTPAPTAVPAGAVVATTPAAPAPAPSPSAPLPIPDIPVVAAAKARKRVPFWAMLGLSLLPAWGFMYVRSLTPSEAHASGPLGVGAETYGGCAGCHGTDGGGGTGYPFKDGEVWKTFPNIEDHLAFVYSGSQAYQLAGVAIAGDPDREGGAHIAGVRGVMPAQSSLGEVDVLAVVCHERYDLNDVERDETFELWCSDESPIFEALESGEATFDNLHEEFAEDGVLPVGTKPRPGQGPRE